MATTNNTDKLKLSQYVGTDPVSFLQNYNNDMGKIDSGTLDKSTYDPSNVSGDAFRATNHKLTGYSKYSDYTPILPSDTSAGGLGKLEAAVASMGDMKASIYDPADVASDAFLAANMKMAGYVKPSNYTPVAESDNVGAAVGKLEVKADAQMDIGTYDPQNMETDIFAWGLAKATYDPQNVETDIFAWSMGKDTYAPDASAVMADDVLTVTSTYPKSTTRYDVQFVVPSGFSGMAGTIGIDGVMCTVKDAMNRDSNFIAAAGTLATLTRSGTSVFPVANGAMASWPGYRTEYKTIFSGSVGVTVPFTVDEELNNYTSIEVMVLSQWFKLTEQGPDSYRGFNVYEPGTFQHTTVTCRITRVSGNTWRLDACWYMAHAPSSNHGSYTNTPLQGIRVETIVSS